MTSGFVGRREDERLVTGRGRYTADCSLPGQAWAAFARSHSAHGIINNIHIEAALAMPGVLVVLTGADMIAAGYMRPQPRMPFKGRTGSLIAPHKPALALDRVRYVGEAVAIIVAETQAQAMEAAELVVVEVSPLSALVDPEDAVAQGAVPVHDDIPGNLCFSFDYGEKRETDDAFAQAEHVVSVALDSTRVVANPIEPRAAIVNWDGDTIDIWCPSQGMALVRGGLAEATGVSPDDIRVHTEDVGGAFGVRGDIMPENVAMALASRKLGRAVKWVATRTECFVCDFHGRAIRMTADLALDSDARFLGIRHDWLCDMGAHPSAAGPLVSIMHSTTMAIGAYAIPAASGVVRLAVTNQVPVSAYRGAGRPDMAYAVERLVDEAAHQLGIDRLEIRRRNMLPPDAFPHRVPTAVDKSSYDSADFAALMQKAVTESDWVGFSQRRVQSVAKGLLRGIGCALFIEPAGGVAPLDEAAIQFVDDGNILLYQVAQSSGQGHETIFPEIVAQVFGMDPAEITLKFPTSNGPAQKGGGAFASRSTMCQGSALHNVAQAVLRKAEALAADELGAEPDTLEFRDGSFHRSGTNQHVSLRKLAAANRGALDCVAESPSSRAYPSGMHIVEVEIDPETGVVALVRYTAVDDCGVQINETLVEGQIVGGLCQGLGQVLGEVCHIDAGGQLLGASFMDYFMPRADTMPEVAVHSCCVPSPTNPLGVKGVGEAGTVGAIPAAMNAILDALRQVGVNRFDMPASSDRVWQALQEARGFAD